VALVLCSDMTFSNRIQKKSKWKDLPNWYIWSSQHTDWSYITDNQTSITSCSYFFDRYVLYWL
jgi:hypothetical protein